MFMYISVPVINKICNITAHVYCIQFTLSVTQIIKLPEPDNSMKRSRCRNRPRFLLTRSRDWQELAHVAGTPGNICPVLTSHMEREVC
jgi:hypothetical protein